MKIDLLSEDPSIKVWLDELCVKEDVKGYYLRSMNEYTECIGKSPKELVGEAKAEIEQGLLINERGINVYLRGFQAYLRNKAFSPKTIQLYMTGVRSFYSAHCIDLPTGNRAKPLKGNNEIPTREDIRDLVKFCDPLETAIVLVGASSGLTASQIVNLKIHHFKNGYDSQTEITALRLSRESTGAEFVTFLTPEATGAVINYLNYRANQKKQMVLSDNDYLFIRRQIPDEDADTGNEETGNEECRKINERTFAGIYHRISKGNLRYITPRSVRKFFFVALINAGASVSDVEFWAGHAVNSAERVYRSDLNKQREIYAKYIPFLTISKS